MKDIVIPPGESVSISTGTIKITATVTKNGELKISTIDSKTHVTTHQQSSITNINFWNL